MKSHEQGEGVKRMLRPRLLGNSPRLIKDSSEQTFFDLDKSILTDKDEKINRLINTLNLCGRYVTKNFFCKKPDHKGERLLKSSRQKFSCEIHYCNNPDCAVQRFSRNIETFKDIKRFDGLRKLWHFSIGFEAISESDYVTNWTQYKKRYEYVLNHFFGKLKKNGVNIEAIRVLDFSFVKNGFVFPHYHFAAIPVGQQRIRSTLILIQKTRKEMIEKQKIPTPFIFKNWRLCNKMSVLSYLAVRSAGMYKHDSTDKTNYKIVPKKLKETIESGKYLFLSDIMTHEEYIDSFYNKTHFVTIGGLPRPLRHGSNITDGMPCECPCCGPISRKDIRVEIVFDEINSKSKPPPDSVMKTYPVEEIKIVRV